MNSPFVPQQQQYGAPNSPQGFQNVPLGPPAPPTSQGPQLKVGPPPTSGGQQLNNLLGKMPTGSNLGQFTVLPPQSDRVSNNNLDNMMKGNNDGSLNNNMLSSGGPPRAPQNGSGANTIPSSQLPPSNFRLNPSGNVRSNSSNNSSSPRLSPSLTPSLDSSNLSNQPQKTLESSYGNLPQNSGLPKMENVGQQSVIAPPTQQSQQFMQPQQTNLPPQAQKQSQNLAGMPPRTQQMNLPPHNNFMSQNVAPPLNNQPQNMANLNNPAQSMPPLNNPPQNMSPHVNNTTQNMPIMNNQAQKMPPPMGNPPQNMTAPMNNPPQNMPPMNNPPQKMAPPMGNLPQNMAQNMPSAQQNFPAMARQNFPPQNMSPPQQNMPPTQQNVPPTLQNLPPNQQNMPPRNLPPTSQLPPGVPPLNVTSTQPQMPQMSQNLPKPPMQAMPQFNSNSNFPPQPQPQSKPPQFMGNMPPTQPGIPPQQPGIPGQQIGMPPKMGYPNQPPMMNAGGGFNQPPLPPHAAGQTAPMPPMVGGGGQMRPGMQRPPLPNQMGGGQSQYPQHQMAQQMQNMSLSGPQSTRNYPMNGAGVGGMMPPMPPPVNGQQMGQMGGNYPSMSPQGYPSQPGYETGQPQYPQAQNRLDPDQVPSPIQMISADQSSRSGDFITNQKGLVPPLCTTKFVVQDQGNASPRFIRSTIYDVPISHEIIKQTCVPFSLVVSPMARLAEGEFAPPIVNFGELGPVRCIRCKAYMCPFMNFVDAGRRFQCAFCKATTDVPTEYFQHLDHNGMRMDKYERPELVLGTYEFIATADYCRNNVLPKPPAFIFVIDVSYNAVKSGLVHLLCAQMKEIIKNLPVDTGMDKSLMKVGFITYDSCVHFYNIKGSLAAPQMMVVGDVNEMFMPLLDGFLSTLEESEVVIDALMEQIPIMFGQTRETETILLPAIQAGLEALKASETSGKLLVFNTSLPTLEAPGKLKNRDDRKLLGTDKERTILTPQNQAYNQLGQDCVAAGCAVDLFLFNNAYIDVATMGQVARLTGGEVFKYTYFQADLDGDRLINDIIMDISRPIAFDAIMRVRTSTGVRPTDFYGHFYMSNTTDIELAAIDCDKAVALEIKHDDKLQEGDGVFIQSALLYTSISGQRRLRIFNLSLKTCSQMTNLYISCDLDTIINYISKQALFKLMDNNPKAVKDAIVQRAAQILANYRKKCANPSSAGQLLLPEYLKLLPLYVNSMLKSDALSGGSDMTVDERSFVIQAVMTMDIPTSFNYFYPRLIPLHDLNPNDLKLPNRIRCTIEKMSEQGVYLLENGIYMFLWIGLGANPDFIKNLFGVQSAIQVNIEQTKLPVLDNPISEYVRNLIEEIRIERHRNMRLTLVRQKEKLDPVFMHFLMEDKGADGSSSYVDFLIHIHREIRNLLS